MGDCEWPPAIFSKVLWSQLRVHLANESTSLGAQSQQGIDPRNLPHDRERLLRKTLANGDPAHASGVLVGVNSEDCTGGRRNDSGGSTSEPAPRVPITHSAFVAFVEADCNVDEDAVRVTHSPDQIGNEAQYNKASHWRTRERFGDH